MLVTKELIDLDELERQAEAHKIVQAAMVQVEDLGDISGHTLVVTVPTHLSAGMVARFRDRLNNALPDDVHLIVATDDVKILKRR